MHLFRTSFLFSIILIFFTSNSLAQESNKELKILSWNIYMLPGITNLSKQIKRNDKKGRAHEIAAYLYEEDYDVIIFQEAFFKPARKILSKGIQEKYPYQYGPFNPSKASLKASSGIFIVSRMPLKVLDVVKYNACDGADCFAKKGAALLQGEFNGKAFQVLGTHLNAGGPQWIREEQYKQMRQLLDDFKLLNVPQIVCGDMNTNQNNTEIYHKMLEMLDVEDIITSSEQQITTVHGTSIIDYIFLRKNNTSIRATSKEVHWFKSDVKRTDVLNGNLSDHLAISASFSWGKPKK